MDLLHERPDLFTARQKVYHLAVVPKEFFGFLNTLNIDSFLHASHYQVHICSQRQKIRERILPEGHFAPENLVHF